MITNSNSPNNTKMSPKKRVLFVITQSEFGGAQRFLYTLVNHLDKAKFEILVAAGPTESGMRNQDLENKNYELLNRLETEGIGIIRLKYLHREIDLVSDVKVLFELRKVVKGFKPNTLFLLSSKAGFLGSFVTKFLIPNSYLPKVIYRIGGWSFN